MAARRLITLDNDATQQHFSITGSTYDPEDGEIIGLPSETNDQTLQYVAAVCSLCNNATLERTSAGTVQLYGEPTEGALKVMTEKMHLHSEAWNQSLNGTVSDAKSTKSVEKVCNLYTSQYEQFALLEFDRHRKSMSVLARKRGKHKNCLFVKV